MICYIHLVKNWDIVSLEREWTTKRPTNRLTSCIRTCHCRTLEWFMPLVDQRPRAKISFTVRVCHPYSMRKISSCYAAINVWGQLWTRQSTRFKSVSVHIAYKLWDTDQYQILTLYCDFSYLCRRVEDSLLCVCWPKCCNASRRSGR